MAGILYVILMILTGRELVNVFLPPEDQSGGRRGSRFLVGGELICFPGQPVPWGQSSRFSGEIWL